MHLPSMTHASAHAWSRLDRIYTNMDPSDLLDRQITAGVWDWELPLSHHRVAFFQCRIPQRQSAAMRPISQRSLSPPTGHSGLPSSSRRSVTMHQQLPRR